MIRQQMEAFQNEFVMPLIVFYLYIILTSEHFVHDAVDLRKCLRQRQLEKEET